MKRDSEINAKKHSIFLTFITLVQLTIFPFTPMSSIPDKHKDFFQSVFEIVRHIPKGRVTSYGAIAKALSTPRSSRMVGWAMNASHSQKKPIPAHRVVNRNGMLTGKIHFPTPTAMQQALEKEGVEVVEDKIVGFKELFWDPNEELSL